MDFQGKFRIGRKENFRYNFFATRKKLIIGSIAVFFIILLITGFIRYGQYGSVGTAILSTLPYAAGGAVLLFLVNLLFIYMRIRSMYKKRAISEFTQEVTLGKDGIFAASENGSTNLAWKHLWGVTETGRDFYLFINASSAYTLPKNQLSSPQDVQNIRTIIGTYAKNSVLKLKG